MSLIKRYYCAALFALITGCANLGEIQEFGKLSSDSAAYTKLTEDYLSAPERQKKYLMESETEAKAELDKSTKDRKKQEEPLKLYHKTIENYMKAIADLAGDQITVYDKELGGLIDSATKASLIEKERAKSLKTISEVLAEAATNYYRQKKLKEVIADANAPLQNVLQDLIVIVGAYSSSIENERTYFDNYYKLLLGMAKGKEPAAAQIISDTYNTQAPTFDARTKAADAYVKTMQTIADAHQKLYDNRNNLSNDKVLATIKDYSKKIYDAYKTIHQPAQTN